MQDNMTNNVQQNIRKNIKENIEEKKNYMRYARIMAGGLCSLIGTILAIYVGGWLMIFKPLKAALFAYFAGSLTYKMIFTTAIKVAFSLTASGAIWCGGYIAKQKFIGYQEA